MIQLRDALHAQPFVPFAVRLTDGCTYTVRHPDFIAIPASNRGREMTLYVEPQDQEPEMHRIDVALVTEIITPPPADPVPAQSSGSNGV
jgi:hypothetical protein